MDHTYQLAKIAQSRNLLSREILLKVEIMERGIEGEKAMADFLKEFGDSSAWILRNLWLNFGSICEADFLWLSPNRWVAFEVKNYNQSVKISDYEAIYDNQVLNTNPIDQARRLRRILEKFTSKLERKPAIEVVIVFINEHCYVEADKIKDIPIISRAQLRSYISRVVSETRGQYYNAMDKENISTFIKKHRIDSPYQLIEKQDLKWGQLIKGINCPTCASFNTKGSRHHICCMQCHNKETKRSALIRMIDEYSILFQTQTIVAKDFNEFVNHIFHEKYLTKLMNKYLIPSSCGSRGKFIISEDFRDRLQGKIL